MKQTDSRTKKSMRVFGMFGALLAIGFPGWWFFVRTPSEQDRTIALSGRIESDEAAIAAKVAGRVRDIGFREGDQVKAGQVIASLDDDQIKAREDQARSAVEQAEAKLRQSQQQIAVLQAQLEQSRLSISQSRTDAEGRVGQAQAQVAAAEASLAQAQAAYEQAKYDEERFTTLAEQGDVSAREGRQAITAAETQKAVVTAAQKHVEAAKSNLIASKANLDNPAIRAAQAAAVERQIQQALSAVASAQAEVDRANGALKEAQASRRDLEILAPFDGIVSTRSAEPGEVLPAGASVATLMNSNQIYLRGFIPEGMIGLVRIGMLARVYLDSNPNKPLEAIVTRIDPQASFTPENTYFRDERVKQVVGVKLQLVDPQGFAKPGMPADGEVLIEGDQWLDARR